MKNKEPDQDIDTGLWYFETPLGRSGPYMCASIAWVWYYKTLTKILEDDDASQSMVA